MNDISEVTKERHQLEDPHEVEESSKTFQTELETMQQPESELVEHHNNDIQCEGVETNSNVLRGQEKGDILPSKCHTESEKLESETVADSNETTEKVEFDYDLDAI